MIKDDVTTVPRQSDSAETLPKDKDSTETSDFGKTKQVSKSFVM